ncbi:MAG: hypothetical protein A2007_02350 [Verrucomicrobia bacterium GWC2_42_7]|nr:MAG: hypothetical protein A2007_02350 [Verrucomicrobia bacterium GWC2_42_7]
MHLTYIKQFFPSIQDRRGESFWGGNCFWSPKSGSPTPPPKRRSLRKGKFLAEFSFSQSVDINIVSEKIMTFQREADAAKEIELLW